MEYIIPIVLTLGVIWSIIIYMSIWGWKNTDNFMYSQSTIHNRSRLFMPPIKNIKEKVMSQSEKHITKNMIKVVVIEGKAYWTSDNIFYVADTNNGDILSETAKQIDTSNMSDEELDKMLVILDNLNNGE